MTGADAAMSVVMARMAQIPADSLFEVQVTDLLPDGVRLRSPIQPDRDVLAPVGLCVLVDAAGGCAMAQAQGSGLSGPTIELRVDHLGEPASGATWLIAESTLRCDIGGATYLTVRVTDDTGGLLAMAQGHFVMLPPDADRGEPLPPRPKPATVDLVAALTSAGADPANWDVPAIWPLSNPRGQVHGGMLMGIGQLAQRRMQLAECSTGASSGVSNGTVPRPLSIAAEYLRPALADGGPLHCRTEYARRGRRFRTLRTELVRVDGRVAATVTGLWSVTG
jgi:acyl-coenzyme A thioesterase PaaI-like protein